MAIAFDLLYRIARETGGLKEGDAYTASGGSTTTVVSAALTEADDAWNRGTLFITRDAAGAGAAPEKQSREITDFTASNDTVTVGTAFTAAPASGDKFAIMRGKFTRPDMIAALNSAIKWYGPIPQEDESLTTLTDTREYTLPASVPEQLVSEVLIATSLTSEYEYTPAPHWHIDLEGRKLIFDYQPTVGYKLKLKFVSYPAAVDSDDDTVSDLYDADTLVKKAYSLLLEWKIARTDNPSKADEGKLNDARNMAQVMKQAHPLPDLIKKPRLMWWAETSEITRTTFLPNH